MGESNLSRNSGRLKKKVKNCLSDTSDKRIKELAVKGSTSWTPNTKHRKELKSCVTKLYKHVPTFTEESDCECGVDYITQPLEPPDFVLLKSATKKTAKYFLG
jgi:hypothetical protein